MWIEAPIIIAGPCAIENQFMLEETVHFLNAKHLHLVRAGLFKPRTDYRSYQGLGTEGIPILSYIKLTGYFCFK